MKNSTKGTVWLLVAIVFVYLTAFIANQPLVWWMLASFIISLMATIALIGTSIYYFTVINKK